MKTEVLFSSSKMDWGTPQDLFDQLTREFGFTIDAAASSLNKKCGSYFGPDHEIPECRDGLSAPWHGVMWVNPPYGRSIGKWVLKAGQERYTRNTTSVLLVPARTDTKWWKHAQSADEIRFLEGRVQFEMPIEPEFRELLTQYPSYGDKDLAEMLKVPQVAIKAARADADIAREAAPFPSALLVFRGWRGPYRWWTA